MNFRDGNKEKKIYKHILMIIIKSDEEINIMRAGGKILAKILDEIAQAVKPKPATAKAIPDTMLICA